MALKFKFQGHFLRCGGHIYEVVAQEEESKMI